MSTPEANEDMPVKKSKLPVIIGIFLALMAGGGSFYAMTSGLLGGAKGAESASVAHEQSTDDSPLPGAISSESDLVFLPIEPVVVNMPPDARHTHLRFVVQLEVDPAHVAELEKQMPRIVDIMNSYLRALEPDSFSDRQILAQIRVHLMARFAVTFGRGYVRDLLVMEFLLS